MDNHAIRYFIMGQGCLYAGILICSLLLPRGLYGRGGMTYFGNYKLTIVPYTFALLGCFWFTLKTIRVLRSHQVGFVRYGLLVCCVLLLGVLAAPYKLNMFFYIAHVYIAAALFLIELLIVFWLALLARRDLVNIVLMILVTAELYLTGRFLGPRLGYLALGQLGFQVLFTAILCRSLPRLTDSKHIEQEVTVAQANGS